MSQQNKVYVGGFPFSLTEAELRDFFSSCGEIQDVALITDRETGRSRGFAFITFSQSEGAEKAIGLNGSDLGGRSLKVNLAQEKTNTGGGGGGQRRARW